MTKRMQKRTNNPCKVLYTGSASKSFTATKCISESNKVWLYVWKPWLLGSCVQVSDGTQKTEKVQGELVMYSFFVVQAIPLLYNTRSSAVTDDATCN